MKWPRKGFGEPSSDIQVWEVGWRELGFRVPGVINFMGEELPILAQGDGVDLSTRVYLHSHQFRTVYCWKLEPGIKGYLTIRCPFHKQGTFGLGHDFNAVCKDHIDAVLGVPEGGLPVTGMVRMVGGCTVGRAVGWTVGLAMVGALAAQLPAGGMAYAASTVSTVQPSGALVASSLCFTGLLWLLLQGSIMVVATTGIAGLSLCRAFIDQVGVATLIAVGEGG